MKSPRGVAASAAILLAIPVAALGQMVFRTGAGVVVHAVLALGSALMSVAVFDFRTPRWLAWLGLGSASVMAMVFLLQGVSEATRNDALTRFVYRVLGQRFEGIVIDVFLLWCIAVLLLDSHGKTRVLGSLVLGVVACTEVYAFRLSFLGTSLNAEAPGLKVLYLLPFVWLLLECGKPRPSGGTTTSPAVGR